MNLSFLHATRMCFLWWAGIALCGCQKEQGPTKVNGQVVEFITGQPVPNAEVQLEVYEGSGSSMGGFGGGGYTAKGTSRIADAQGKFSFTFNANAHRSYSLRGNLLPYYRSVPDYDMHIVNGDNNQDLRVPVYALAWVRLQIIDEPPKSRVSLYITGFEGNGEELNYPRDTILIRPGIAGLTKGIYWFKTEAGIDTRNTELITLAPLDTVTVRIIF